MWLLLPTTLGVGTAVLWARSLNWPRSIGSGAVILRSRRRVPWDTIRTISVRRHYCDDHTSRIEISFRGGRCTFPTRALRNGESVAAATLAMFKQTGRMRTDNSSVASEAGNDGYDDARQIPSSGDLQPNAPPAPRSEPFAAWDDASISGSNSNDHSIRTHTAA